LRSNSAKGDNMETDCN